MTATLTALELYPKVSHVVPEVEWADRTELALDVSDAHVGVGRELFGGLRQMVSGAEQGAMTFGGTEQSEA